MKKVKIMLASVALIAVVGAAFAFKAKDSNRTFYSLDPNDGFCSVETQIPSTTTAFASAGTFAQLSTSAATAQGACPLIKLKTSA